MDIKTKKMCLATTVIAFITMIISFVLDFFFQNGPQVKVGQVVVHNTWVQLILSTIALACAFIYILKDGKKDAAPYLKAFTGAYLLTYIYFFIMALASAVYSTSQNQAMLHLFILTLLVGYSSVLMLTFARNQGKKVSLILAAVAVVVELIIFFFLVSYGISIAVVFTFVSKLLMLNIFYTLIEVKYQDKDARGTI